MPCGRLAMEARRGKATLVSWVVYHTAFNEAFKDKLPYTCAVVQLAEGPRMISNIVHGVDPQTLKIDQPPDTDNRAGRRRRHSALQARRMSALLKDLRIVEFTQVLAGPFAGAIFPISVRRSSRSSGPMAATADA